MENLETIICQCFSFSVFHRGKRGVRARTGAGNSRQVSSYQIMNHHLDTLTELGCFMKAMEHFEECV